MSAPHPREPAEGRVNMQFEDNTLLPQLFGERDRNLERIERQLGVSVVSRGNRLAISGPSGRAEIARAALQSLYERLERGMEIDAAAVDAALSARAGARRPARRAGGRKRARSARASAASRRAGRCRRSISRRCARTTSSSASGPPAPARPISPSPWRVDMLMSGAVERIVLSRPAVEAGERLGFLPGDLARQGRPLSAAAL